MFVPQLLRARARPAKFIEQTVQVRVSFCFISSQCRGTQASQNLITIHIS